MLRQEGSVDEYIQVFKSLVAQAEEVGEEQLIGYFMGGLKPSIRSRVRTLDPGEILKAMNIARDIEGELRVQRIGGMTKVFIGGGRLYNNNHVIERASPSSGPVSQSGPSGTRGSGSRPNGSLASDNRSPNRGSTSVNPRTHFGSSGNTANLRSRNNRQLPYDEYIKRREEGRCFHCGLAFGPGHRCPDKH